MDVRFKCGILVLVAGSSSGCATVLRTGGDLTTDRYAAVRAEVTNRPPVPSEDQLLPSVELVTFTYDVAGVARRDTVRGRERVAEWLDGITGETGRDRVSFMLQPSEVRICDGAAVERGRYPVPQRLGRTEDYLALWRPGGDRWRLERLWLSPSPSVSVAELATNCVGKPWGVNLGAAVGVASSGDMAQVVNTALPLRYDETSHREGFNRPEVGLWVSIRAMEWLRGQFHYGHRRLTELHGRNFSPYTGELVEEFFLELAVDYWSLLAEVRLGSLALAVGPLLVETGLQSAYSARASTVEQSWMYAKLGGAARVSGGVLVFPGFRALISAGYRYVPDVEVEIVSSPYGVQQAPVEVGGLDLVIGLELLF